MIKNRRSIRDFEDSPVSLETIKEIINEGCLAPSSGNRQEWRFSIVINREWIRKLSNESKRNILREIEENPATYMSRYKEALKNENFNVFYNAPCLILILGPKDNHSLEIDCTLMASYIMFSATARGLGTCWIGLGNYINNPHYLNELGITDDLKIVAPIILGYPKRIPGASERKDPRILGIID